LGEKEGETQMENEHEVASRDKKYIYIYKMTEHSILLRFEKSFLFLLQPKCSRKYISL
jgi:hypothetical protein